MRFARLSGENSIMQPAFAERLGERTAEHYARNIRPADTITVKTAAAVIDAD
ncbi:hypothetical protein [Bradyrhizobium sp. AZCC 2289]|uniref:hypothetical protein n=1 Tax=Bradyrhizobium sp. AZCC 2289 TaxID=3117026 RepID=UPI002FF299E1